MDIEKIASLLEEADAKIGEQESINSSLSQENEDLRRENEELKKESSSKEPHGNSNTAQITKEASYDDEINENMSFGEISDLPNKVTHNASEALDNFLS